jgi:hypothetical protein
MKLSLSHHYIVGLCGFGYKIDLIFVKMALSDNVWYCYLKFVGDGILRLLRLSSSEYGFFRSKD